MESLDTSHFFAEALQTFQDSPTAQRTKSKTRKTYSQWFMASWNVRLLVDIEDN